MARLQTQFIVFAAMFLLLLSACQAVAPQADTPSACSEIDVQYVDGTPDLQGCILRIAVENAYQPFNYIDPDSGEAVGYDYDFFADACERLNCTPEFIETSWDAIVAIIGGEGTLETFDVGADGITITEERAQNVDFSDPFIKSAQVLLARIDEDRYVEPEDFAAMTDLVIGTQLGTTNYNAAVNLVGEDRVVAYDIFGTAVQALINGDVDAVMIDNVAGLGYVGVNADSLKITGTAVESEELGFIFGKESQLTDAVNWALEQMREDGALDTLYTRWFDLES